MVFSLLFGVEILGDGSGDESSGEEGDSDEDDEDEDENEGGAEGGMLYKRHFIPLALS